MVAYSLSSVIHIEADNLLHGDFSDSAVVLALLSGPYGSALAATPTRASQQLHHRGYILGSDCSFATKFQQFYDRHAG